MLRLGLVCWGWYRMHEMSRVLGHPALLGAYPHIVSIGRMFWVQESHLPCPTHHLEVLLGSRVLDLCIGDQ